MTPAPETGRTAEEMRAEIRKAIVAAMPENIPLRGRMARSIMAAVVDPLLSEAAQLRSRLLQAEQGGEISGRDPSGPGSHPTGGTPDGFPSLRDVDPSRWELSEETRAFIREIDLATVGPGDPRLSQTLIGPAGPAIGLDGYGSKARPLAPTYDPPRCTATGNPCGTDTCIVGHECPDSRWGGRCAHRIAKRVAALGIEARQGRDEGSACESPAPTGAMPEALAAKAAPLPDSDTGGGSAA